MGQTTGGNTGNLELLKRIEELEQTNLSLSNRLKEFEVNTYDTLSDFVDGNVHVRSIARKGNVCEIFLHMSGMNMTGINGTYCKVPENYRPLGGERTVNCGLVFNGQNICGRASIFSDGTVRQTYGTGTVTSIMLYGTYLL